METVTCDKCNTEFEIVHQLPLAEANRARKQAQALKSTLHAEHVDEKHYQHPDSYDLSDDLIV